MLNDIENYSESDVLKMMSGIIKGHEEDAKVARKDIVFQIKVNEDPLAAKNALDNLAKKLPAEFKKHKIYCYWSYIIERQLGNKASSMEYYKEYERITQRERC